PSSQLNSAAVRTQTPTLALPPLSPDRAPAMTPSGIRLVSVASARAGLSGAGSRGRTSSAAEAAFGADGRIRASPVQTGSPSIRTRVLTSSAGTAVGQYTPYIDASPGGVSA